MVKKAVCYSFSLNAEEPMAYLRLKAPLREAGITLINGFEKGQTSVEVVEEAEVVIFQREFPTRYEEYRKISALARREGKPIVFEIDDLLFFLPENHPDRHGQYFGPTLLPMYQALLEADVITVTTPKLRDVLLAFNPNVVVLPNYFDDRLWHLNPPMQIDSSENVLTIGYMGTNSHKPDLEYLKPVLLELVESYPNRLRFHFWGAQPPAELETLPQVQWTSQNFPSYPDFAAFFQTQAADIFIAPLADHLFNRCKSPIKFFEYSALGAPGVFSRLEPYAEMVVHEHTGMLASSLDEWRTSLVKLIENDELRYQLAVNAQAAIRENWLLSQNAFRWQTAFEKGVEVASSRQLPLSPHMDMLTAINSQLVETFNHKEALEKALRMQLAEKEHTIRTLEAQVAQRDHNAQILTTQLNQTKDEVERLKTEVERLKSEVVGYALSKSWRWTRPFRSLERKMKRFLGSKNA